ncbi:MAG: hypothetical protein WC451_01695 [Patescibacteria group bacterium]
MLKRKSNESAFNSAIKNQETRSELARRNHLAFFTIYLSHFAKYKIAPFHHEFFRLTEDENTDLAVITAFRGSAKSTIFTLSNSIWSIVGKMQKKYVVIFSQTQEQVRQHFKNLKMILGSPLMKDDLGPFEEDEWNATSLYIPKYRARIMVASVGQKIRGFTHGEHRPDLIVLDDVENNESVETQEGRDKTYRWFVTEILPLGDSNTKCIIVGSPLHEDSLLLRLKTEITSGKRSGVYREFPLLDDDDNIAWPGKYSNMEAIEKLRLRIGNEFAFQREYLLKPIDDKEPVVRPEWIHQFSGVPQPTQNETVSYAIGVDPSLGDGDKNDPTGIVSCMILGSGKNKKYYILPNIINKQMGMSEVVATLDLIIKGFGGQYSTTIYVEEVALQGWLTRELQSKNFRAVGVKIHGLDKKTRLGMTTNRMQLGKILFCNPGTEILQNQMLKFGMLKHEDVADAYSTLIQGIAENESKQETVEMINCRGMYSRII